MSNELLPNESWHNTLSPGASHFDCRRRCASFATAVAEPLVTAGTGTQDTAASLERVRGETAQ